MGIVYRAMYELYVKNPSKMIGIKQINENVDIEDERLQNILIMLEDQGSIYKVESGQLIYYKLILKKK